MLRLIILLIVTACISTGCATVNRGIDDHFRIDTVPQGAKITTSIETPESKRNRRKNKNITPEYEGCNPTPCAIQLSRKSEFTFTVEHAGYEPVEMFITNSKKRGSFAATTAANTATTAGLAGASLAWTTWFTGATLGSGAASFAAPAIAVSTVPPALAATGAMLLVDAGTGANLNLFPNPVVLELTPEGQPVQTDPAAILFNEIKATEEKYNQNCKSGRKANKKIDECPVLKLDLSEKKENLKTLLSPLETSDDS